MGNSKATGKMFKAILIVLAFWVLAYECEGALFFYHVQKSAERSGPSNTLNEPIKANENVLLEDMTSLLSRIVTTKTMLKKKPICRINDVSWRFSCMPIIPINISRLQRLQRLQGLSLKRLK